MNSGLIGALGAAPLRVTGMTRRIVTSAPNANVNVLQLQATGGSKNVDLVLTTKGTGAFMLGSVPDGTITGGNKRGLRAVDLQVTHGSAANVASGDDSFAAGTTNRASGGSSVALGSTNTSSGGACSTLGIGNIASGLYATAVGFYNNAAGSSSFSAGSSNNTSAPSSGAIGESITSSGYGSFGTGYGSNARLAGMQAMAGYAGWGSGGAQAIRYIQSITTTNDTPTEMYGQWNQGERYTIPSGNTHFVSIFITAASTTNTASYARQICIRNTAGTTSIIGSVQTIGTDQETDAAWNVTVEANDTNDALRILVTGTASTTIRWLALIDGIELKNP